MEEIVRSARRPPKSATSHFVRHRFGLGGWRRAEKQHPVPRHGVAREQELVRRRRRRRSTALLLASAHLEEERELLILLLDDGAERPPPGLAVRHAHPALHRRYSPGASTCGIRVPAGEICGASE